MLLLFAAKTELIFDNYGSLVTKITDIDAIEEPTIMPDIVSMRFAREIEPKEKQDAEMENILQLIADLLEEDANYDTLHLLLKISMKLILDVLDGIYGIIYPLVI